MKKNRDRELINKLNRRKKDKDVCKELQTECYGECHDCGCDCEFNETPVEELRKVELRKVKNIPIKFKFQDKEEPQTECYGECHDCGCDCEFNETPEYVNKEDSNKIINECLKNNESKSFIEKGTGTRINVNCKKCDDKVNGRVYNSEIFDNFLNSLDEDTKNFVGELKHKNRCDDKELIEKLNQKILTDSYFDNKKKDFEKVLSNTETCNTDINQLSSAIEKSKVLNKRVEELFDNSKKETYYTADEIIAKIRQEMEKFFERKEIEKKNNWDIEAKKVWQYIYCSLFNIKDYMELISIEDVTYDKLQELFDQWFDLFYTKRDNIKK